MPLGSCGHPISQEGQHDVCIHFAFALEFSGVFVAEAGALVTGLTEASYTFETLSHVKRHFLVTNAEIVVSCANRSR